MIEKEDLVADKDGAELPTREEIFLRAMAIVEEIEDQLDLLSVTLRSNWQPADAELGQYASDAVADIQRSLYRLLRYFNLTNRHLGSAYDSLPEAPESEP
ncbi:MAG: hypothetical protein U0R81_16250 [Mycobacterium sp.]